MTLTTDRWPDDTSLRPAYPALPLFGWTLLAAIGQMLIVPAPWARHVQQLEAALTEPATGVSADYIAEKAEALIWAQAA